MASLVDNLLGIDNHYFVGFAFGESVCNGDHGSGNQAVAVVAKGMAHEMRLAAGFSLLAQARIGIDTITFFAASPLARLLIKGIDFLSTTAACRGSEPPQNPGQFSLEKLRSYQCNIVGFPIRSL